MKTKKFVNQMALLLIMAILMPLTAMGGPRDAAVAGPIDDQPWGGEIDNGDFRTGSVSSTGYELYPTRFDIIGIRNIGTPLVLFDYLRIVIFDYSYLTENSSTVNQVNISSIPESTSYSPAAIKNTRYSIRKGR